MHETVKSKKGTPSIRLQVAKNANCQFHRVAKNAIQNNAFVKFTTSKSDLKLNLPEVLLLHGNYSLRSSNCIKQI